MTKDEVLQNILVAEGGYVNHPADIRLVVWKTRPPQPLH